MIKKLGIASVILSGATAFASSAHVVSTDDMVQRVISGVAVSQSLSGDPIYCSFDKELDLGTRYLKNGNPAVAIQVNCGAGQDETSHRENIKVVLNAVIVAPDANVVITSVRVAK